MVLATAMLCLAANVYYESRGEPLKGQLAVAHVTVNRSIEREQSICDVVMDKNQFAWTKEKAEWYKGNVRIRPHFVPREPKAWERAQLIALRVMLGLEDDFTRGATFFHEVSIRPGRRSSKRTEIAGTWGNHIFFRPKGVSHEFGNLKTRARLAAARLDN